MCILLVTLEYSQYICLNEKVAVQLSKLHNKTVLTQESDNLFSTVGQRQIFFPPLKKWRGLDTRILLGNTLRNINIIIMIRPPSTLLLMRSQNTRSMNHLLNLAGLLNKLQR